METITDNGKILGILLSEERWQSGLHFLTKDEEYIQAGTWVYEKGKQLGPHIHKESPRTSLRTQEVLCVRKGKLLASIYNDERLLIRQFELSAGDVYVSLAGGHGYTILEDGTEVLEVKNGPYPGHEKDREVFSL